MQTLSRDLRRNLETTVRSARRTAETGARAALEQLAVHHHEPWASLSIEQRSLRVKLRAHAKQLGDARDEKRGTQAIDRLLTECAYEQWHRMLFARFLAETELLIEPRSGVAISLDECQELARERGEDWLELAANFAQAMLPQIFRAGDPVLEVALPPETRSKLEDLMKALPRAVFIADDSLGWVYQFWQADRKDEVNRSEKKIGADELAAVTQLFTEDYMVLFLLHNTLGAWWAGKVLAKNPTLAVTAKDEDEIRAACSIGGLEWTYLRFVRESDGEAKGSWRPAAGTFNGWPTATKDITLLDPCMGSGHFLVFALPILAALRREEEGFEEAESIEAVLRDNLFGLELDGRCTQIAAFNLALAAWRRAGFRPLPALHLACSGLSLGVTKAEWLKLAERAARALPTLHTADALGAEDSILSDATKRGFERLHDLFVRAPWLGSLIDPRGAGSDLIEHGFADLEPLLVEAFAQADDSSDSDLSEMAVVAQGVAKAAEILSGRFTLVATNVPYLALRRQSPQLQQYGSTHYPECKNDLSVIFTKRCIELTAERGTTAVVASQYWLFKSSYESARRDQLAKSTWNVIVRLGARAFETITGEVVNVYLGIFTKSRPAEGSHFHGCDLTNQKSIESKVKGMRSGSMQAGSQSQQLANPQCKISFDAIDSADMLARWAVVPQGVKTGDDDKWRQCFWEQPDLNDGWLPYQTTVSKDVPYGGRSLILDWRTEGGSMVRPRVKNIAVGRKGVAVSQSGDLAVTLYTGERFDSNVAPIVPEDESVVPALWAYCTSNEYRINVRKVDQSLKVTNVPLVQVPFDFERWSRIAAESGGIPRPHTTDPTQWLFDGRPESSNAPLQVAVARLVGYRWPRQTGSSFSDCPALGPDGLESHADQDGIVALNPVKGEAPASDRLTALLADAYGANWSAAKLAGLLEGTGFAGRALDDWLRDGFFEQHCALFQQRPFVWHVWDGRRDGFHALVNYHRISAANGEGRRTLEKLLYTYLGDWIDHQRTGQNAGVEGADARVTAALQLQTELTKILAGEPPYDLFVRWKPLSSQAIGWEPDVNDGVRLNIRPFVTAKALTVRSKGTSVLRVTPKQIDWDKDRGKEPQREMMGFPWFWGWDEATQDFTGATQFDGNRWNDLHYSTTMKRKAREAGDKT